MKGKMFHPIFSSPPPAMPETRKKRYYSNTWYLSIKLLIANSVQI